MLPGMSFDYDHILITYIILISRIMIGTNRGKYFVLPGMCFIMMFSSSSVNKKNHSVQNDFDLLIVR